MSDPAAGTDATIDPAQLTDWLERALDGFEGPLTIVRFAGGQSNPTYRLHTPGRDYVMRSKPPGTTLSSAHAIEREFRVMKALAGQGVPVPRVRRLCEDPAVIGRSFYIMDFVDGDILWRPDLPEIAVESRPHYFDALNQTLADLHTLDPAALGLSDYGKGEAYLRRQIDRWTRQYKSDEQAGRIERMDVMAAWLAANAPTGNALAIVHGDFRINNIMFERGAPKVAAVLDWELSTIGDPITDFAYHLMMYRVPAGIQGGGLKGLDLQALNLPSEDDYVRAYCDRTGRVSIPDLQFHLAYNLFRFAAIVHGIKARALRGNASSDRALDVAAALETYVDLAWDQAVLAGMR
ncbi:MAG: phosphotransferase family protein [Hyphomonadaceae bacterium]